MIDRFIISKNRMEFTRALFLGHLQDSVGLSQDTVRVINKFYIIFFSKTTGFSDTSQSGTLE